jgi:hypothetical protein
VTGISAKSDRQSVFARIALGLFGKLKIKPSQILPVPVLGYALHALAPRERLGGKLPILFSRGHLRDSKAPLLAHHCDPNGGRLVALEPRS